MSGTAHDASPPGGEQTLPDRMAAAARDLETQVDPEHTYRMATLLAVDNIDGCDAASLSLVSADGSRIESVAATDEEAARADALQQELGEGPCLDAIHREATTHSPALAESGRWPSWGPRVVAETGLASVLSVHLFTHQDLLGALNLYSRETRGFALGAQHDGIVIAAHIATAFAAAQRIENLGKALATRTVTGQATGMVMERYAVDADVAFRILARLASQEERKLREVAADIVASGRVPRVGS